MRFTRNKLTEQLLGLEVEIRFISLREAKLLHGGTVDDFLLERALHSPILQAIQGEKDIIVLAAALSESLKAHGFSTRVARLLVSLFLSKN